MLPFRSGFDNSKLETEMNEHNNDHGVSKPKPMGMVGAGPLTSTIWKTGDERGGWSYRFNLFRMSTRGGRVSQLFRPTDLVDFVKIARVLASVIADDGCLSRIDRAVLKRLAAELDDLLGHSNETSIGITEPDTHPETTNNQEKGGRNGNTPHS